MSQLVTQTKATPVAQPFRSLSKKRNDFPSLRSNEVYLDSAASSLTPRPVMDAVADFYVSCRANVQRGAHRASTEATDRYEAGTRNIERFFGAEPDSISFTMNATTALNAIALALNFEEGDELIVPSLEHVSNMAPWVRVAKTKGARIRWWNPDPSGRLRVDDLLGLFSNKTKLVSVGHVSNVLGTVAPVADVAQLCKEREVVFVLDACQSAPHMPVDVGALGCDFMVASAHKMLGPTGVGLLYVNPRRAELTEPAIIGSDSVDNTTCPGMGACSAGQMPQLKWATPGTPPIAQVLGWSAAVDYLRDIGFDAVARHDRELVFGLVERLASNPRIVLYGPTSASERVSIVAFNVQGLPSDEVGRILSENYNIGVRAGTHCALGYFMENQPDIQVNGNVRASIYLYNTQEEVEQLADALDEIAEQLAD